MNAQREMVEEKRAFLLSLFQNEPTIRNMRAVTLILDDIVCGATRLALIFSSSKAVLMPCWPTTAEICTGQFSESDMEKILLNVKCKFALPTKPGLTKHGNADGEYHGTSTIMIKPEVVYY